MIGKLFGIGVVVAIVLGVWWTVGAQVGQGEAVQPSGRPLASGSLGEGPLPPQTQRVAVEAPLELGEKPGATAGNEGVPTPAAVDESGVSVAVRLDTLRNVRKAFDDASHSGMAIRRVAAEENLARWCVVAKLWREGRADYQTIDGGDGTRGFKLSGSTEGQRECVAWSGLYTWGPSEFPAYEVAAGRLRIVQSGGEPAPLTDVELLAYERLYLDALRALGAE